MAERERESEKVMEMREPPTEDKDPVEERHVSVLFCAILCEETVYFPSVCLVSFIHLC